jgi:hypothetical protein
MPDKSDRQPEDDHQHDLAEFGVYEETIIE